MTKARKLLVSSLIGLSAAALVMAAYFWGTPFLELVELKARDALFLARGPVASSSGQVAVVAVSERSLDRYGRWPWPRKLVAELIQATAAGGARVIALDMGFFEPDQRLPLNDALALARSAAQGGPLDQDRIIKEFHPDYILARTLAQSPVPVILGYFFHMSPAQMGHLDQDQIKARQEALRRFAFPVVRFATPEALDRHLIQGHTPEINLPVYNRVVQSSGFFNILPDEDGVVRRLPLVMQYQEDFFPSLVMASLALALGKKLPPLIIHEYGLDAIHIGPIHIPVDEEGRLMINYRGGEESLPVVDAADLLDGGDQKKSLKGKAVLIGVTAAGVEDVRPTPLTRQLSGTFIHAQALDNILSGDFLARSNWTAVWDLAAICGLAWAAALLVGFLHPLRGGVLGLGLGTGYALSVYGLFRNGLLVSLVHPLLALVLSGVVMVLFRYLVEERDKRFIRRAFQHYLSPTVISVLLKQPAGLRLGGERRKVSVLFADISGFTSLSERLEPEMLAKVLNTFMERMSRAIFDHEGVLDKYIGDEVMAFFGAPVEQPDHAQRACRTALAMAKELDTLDDVWEGMGLPRLGLDLGIGINSGPVVVGNMGSRLRFDYTAVGDNVNLASRLVNQAKDYGVRVLVSQATRDLCADQFQFRAIDRIRVMGKELAAAVYELTGPLQAPEPDFCRLSDAAFQSYLNRDFAQAVDHLERLLEQRPQDRPAALLRRRCLEYMQTPPPPEWDGVETKKYK
jgi:adenylate cyclase